LSRRFLIIVTLLVASAACGKDNKGGTDIPCTNEEYWDHVNSECVPRFRMDPPDAGDDLGDAGGSDEPDMAEPDMGAQNNAANNNANNNTIEPGCDNDNDGVESVECGGDDCDDSDPLVSPRNPEFCDTIDNDCDTVVNEGINCSFYAHSGQTLYAIDPFTYSLTELGAELPNLQDIDTHPSGLLLGVSFDGLYQYDDLRDYWWLVGEFGNDGPSDPNGMAIDSAGRTFVTSQDEIWEIDIVTGDASFLGILGEDANGEPFYSSGDCVVNKLDSLYMTSKHDPDTDWLLLVNRDNATAQEIGPIGSTRVFALTAAWGELYGLTDNGALLNIDSDTGEGTVLHQFQGVRFFGAASTPSR
jgi:hypothetical protein